MRDRRGSTWLYTLLPAGYRAGARRLLKSSGREISCWIYGHRRFGARFFATSNLPLGTERTMLRHLVFHLTIGGVLAIHGGAHAADLDQWAEQAVSSEPALANTAMERLRRAGPDGLDALFLAHADLLDQRDDQNPQWHRLQTALDAVGAQRYCHTSRLYWYTDFQQAKTAALQQRKPILSLRLLGRLTDEHSCANSRFFRATLYANRKLSHYLRERFILHWSSERPVPVVTVDFGDGRTIKTTLTGNSIHYILDAEGRPVDALPGLYGPQAFRRELEQAAQLVDQLVDQPDSQRQEQLVQYHRAQLETTVAAWQSDLKEVGVEAPEPGTMERRSKGSLVYKIPGAARAKGAMDVAVGKGIAEMPMLRNLFPRDPQWLAENTTPAHWLQLARLHADDATLDAASRSFMQRQQPSPDQSLWPESSSPDGGFGLVVRHFQNLIAVDTVRNEYTLHRKLHEWFAEDADQKLGALNERVYAELFLTPRTDPWLGLLPRGTYPALAQYGLQP